MTTKRIEFGEFRLTDVTRANVLKCLESEWLTMGPVVKEFETKWKNLFGYKHVRAVNSGTSADLAACLALYELGAKPGDEVICPALSFIATANSIRASNLRPVPVDVEIPSMNIDTFKIEDAITPKTRAIMSVNLMGRPAKLDIIQDICNRYNLIHIVDNCEAYGAKYKGKYSLEYADMECTSHFNAHIAFSVELGTVSVNETSVDNLIEGIRSHGRMYGSNDFNHEIFGLNLKPTDLHCSVGLEEVDLFWDCFMKRKQNLRTIREACNGFEDLAYFSEIDVDDELCAPHAFSITMKKPQRIHGLKFALDDAAIAHKKNFKSMFTEHRCFQYLGHKFGDFPNAEFMGTGLHIGVHKYLDSNDLDRITSVLRKFLSGETI